MPAVVSKPRWLQWERHCLEAAFEQHIQLKVMAAVFHKSVSAVSKKIHAMGLRTKAARLKYTQDNRPPYVPKDKLSHDFQLMETLVQLYGPASSFSSNASSCFAKKQDAFFKGDGMQKVSYTMAKPLPYRLLEEADIPLPGVEKDYDETFYVPFSYIEKWALQKGFCRVNADLHGKGVYYWKQGSYFSKTELIVYLNGVRSLKHLAPLHLSEEDIEDQEMDKS